MEHVRRSKTANPASNIDYSTDLAAATFDRPESRPMSNRNGDTLGLHRPATSRSRPQTAGIQTDNIVPTYQEFPQGGSNLFYPYILPYQPMPQPPTTSPMYGFFYGPYPMANGVPAAFPAQSFNQSPYIQTNPVRARSAHPGKPVPIIRMGRNGSCWRHIKQCTGNLGNNIMFIDGVVKEDDCRQFPPHGYYSANNNKSYLSVSQRLAPLGKSRPLALSSTYNDKAKNDFKFWYEDRTKRPAIPSSIQGRMMKSGAAY